jgi:hypothetical protein
MLRWPIRQLNTNPLSRQLAMAELAAASAVLQQYAAWLMGDPVTLQEMKAALASNDPTSVHIAIRAVLTI